MIKEATRESAAPARAAGGEAGGEAGETAGGGTAVSRLDARPKYRVLQDLIRQGIADGSLVREGKLPSEQDMARRFGVAYMTVRTAVNDLVAQRLLRRVHGKGTFVLEPPAGPVSAGVLALLVPSLASLWNVAGLFYFPSIVQGFCAEATRLGYEPTVIGRASEAITADSVEFHSLAGAACLLISREDAGSLEVLRNLRLPAVGINRYLGRRAISCVAADQAAGMAEAVELLVRLGHRHIAFLDGPRGNLGAEERRQGFLRGMEAHGLPPIPADAAPADYTEGSGQIRARRLLALPEPPTAIVTAGDLIAAGVLAAAREAGLEVPGDLSVVGYGDFQIATFLQPELTTVRLPLADLGVCAARLLHEQVSGAQRQRVTLLPATLVERDSVAPPREDRTAR